MARYDLIIIGSGPAGLSAALTARNRNLNFLLFGSRNLSDKIAKAHRITNYLGLPDIAGADLEKVFRSQIDGAGIEIREERIGMVYSMGDYFTLQVGQEILEATAVILATGVSSGKPYPGEEELLGRGISYCATCDGNFYRGRPVAVISGSPSEETEAEFLSGICSQVLYFPLYPETPSLPENVTVIREKPNSIEKNEDSADTKVTLITDSGRYPVDCVFILRQTISPGKLVPGIAEENGHVAVDRKQATNLPGLFAAGDITGTPYQYMKAAGEGNVAALSAASWITKQKKES
jgi:thioredoxin reductase (NADPH)